VETSTAEEVPVEGEVGFEVKVEVVPLLDYVETDTRWLHVSEYVGAAWIHMIVSTVQGGNYS
jgi:hypothetical protein